MFATWLLALHALWVGLRFGGEAGTQVFTDLFLIGVPLAAAVATGHRAFLEEGRRRAAWACFAFASLSWGLGGAAWGAYEIMLGHEVPFPSVADIGYLGLIPFAMLGFLLLAWPPERAAACRTILDGLLIGLSLAALAWSTFLGPVVAASSGTALQNVIGLAYPVGDIMLLATITLAAGQRSVEHRRSLMLVAAGFGSFAVADMGFAWLTTLGTYRSGHWIDLGWTVGFVVLGAAALTLPGRETTPTAARPSASGTTVLLPFVPFAAALVAALHAYYRTHVVDDVLSWLFLGVFLALVARQTLLAVENRGLHARLARAFADLRQADLNRNGLLRQIVHDIRNPLSPIRLQLQLLSLDATEGRPSSRVAIIERNLTQIERLVSDISDVAVLGSETLDIQPQEFDVDEVLRDIHHTMLSEAEARSIELRYAAQGPIPVHADRTRIRQVIGNLVSNALKFTPAGGHVELRAVTADGEGRIEVSDDGRGVTEDERRRLFRAFSRIDRPGHPDVPGTGLGLYISRGIIERHGGRIDVESEGHGKGTTFRVRIPLAAPSLGRACWPEPAPARAAAPLK